jgi:hypothetical protein
VPVVNDQMVRPKFMAKAALFHIKETKHVVQDAKPVTLNIEIIREENDHQNHNDGRRLPAGNPLPGAYPDADRKTAYRYHA